MSTRKLPFSSGDLASAPRPKESVVVPAHFVAMTASLQWFKPVAACVPYELVVALVLQPRS